MSRLRAFVDSVLNCGLERFCTPLDETDDEDVPLRIYDSSSQSYRYYVVYNSGKALSRDGSPTEGGTRRTMSRE
jgi:hypothetical protein